jgi:signal peptidase II
MRWPTFNVADIAVSTGALLLAWVLWGEERHAHAAAAGAPAGTPGTS